MITAAASLGDDTGAPTMGDPLTDLPLVFLYDPVVVYFLTAAMVAMLAGLLLDTLRRGFFFCTRWPDCPYSVWCRITRRTAVDGVLPLYRHQTEGPAQGSPPTGPFFGPD